LFACYLGHHFHWSVPFWGFFEFGDVPQLFRRSFIWCDAAFIDITVRIILSIAIAFLLVAEGNHMIIRVHAFDVDNFLWIQSGELLEVVSNLCIDAKKGSVVG
jgi:hypothetical protein